MQVLRQIFSLLFETVTETMRQRGPGLAAAISFYTILSLAPLLIILITLVGLFLGQSSVQAFITEQIQLVAGEDIARSISQLMQGQELQRTSVVATVISLGFMFFSAGGMFGQLYVALNTMWNVPPNPTENGILGFVRFRLVAALMTMGAVVALFLSMLLRTLTEVLRTQIRTELETIEFMQELPRLDLDPLLLVVVIFIGMVVILKFVPDASAGWRDIVIGAVFTTILFKIGELVIVYYLSTTSQSIYGAASSLIAILLWIYYIAQIILFGAKFTYVFASKHGTPILPRYKELMPARGAPISNTAG